MRMKNKGKRMLALFLVMILSTSSLTVNASQSRGSNFNKNYTLNGSQADNIVAVALAQQGKTKAQLGYTEAWCADFVSDCAQLAGVGNVIPFDGYCQTLYNKVKNAGGRDVSSPKKGDLVFYYCSACKVHWCHVGLMIDSQRSIEGNYGGKVSLVNGAYRDSAGHSLSNGIVTRKFVTPAYTENTLFLTTPQLSLSAGTNTYGHGASIAFNWTWGGSEADGYNLFIAKNIEGTKEYDWKNARRTFFPGNATTSGIISPSVFAPGGGYAAYMQACAPNDKRSGQSNFVYFVVEKPKAQWKIWISRSKMGNETEVVPVGKTCYLCYQIIDKDTQKNWDELYNSNYEVKETFTFPNGKTYSYAYTNDNNWIAITPAEAGKYKGTVEIAGDFTDKLECSFTVKKFYYGDIDSDDDITVTDLSMANQAVNNPKILTAEQKKRADVNADGAVTKADVTLITEYVLGTITEFPAENHVHSYSSKVTENATCTSAGVRTYSCVCGESYTTAIPRISHTTVSDPAVAATCTRNGKTAGSHCSVCGAVLKAQAIVPMTGHHKVLKNAREASCTQTGYTGDTYCKDCGKKLSDGKIIAKIPEHVHNYTVRITKEATCSNEGIKTYTCPCGHTYTERMEKTPHKEVTDEAQAAACTQNGKTQGSHCSICGIVIIACKTVPATGHMHTEVRNARTATTLSAGYTGDTYCKDCGVKISSGKITEKIREEEGGKTGTDDPLEDKELNTDRKENGITDERNDLEDEEDDVENEEDEEMEVGDLLYDVQGKAEYKVIKITGNSVFVSYNATLNKRQKTIAVPNQIKTEEGFVCKVSAISQKAFYKNKRVRKIILGNQITKIGARAFSGCNSLSSLTIKSKKISSKSLSSKAFKGISSKVKIKVPKTKRNSYRKLFLKKGLSKKVKVCNI